MNDVDLILEVIVHHAIGSFAHICEGEENWPADDALRSGRHEVLQALAAEIRASLRPADACDDIITPVKPREMWFFLTERFGTMRATVFDTYAKAAKARKRFRRTYKLKTDYEGDVACAIQSLRVAPRDPTSAGRLDVRLACLVRAEGTLWVSIHDTDDELVEATDQASNLYGKDAWITYDTILIPWFD
jgi:hypothetical protein